MQVLVSKISLDRASFSIYVTGLQGEEGKYSEPKWRKQETLRQLVWNLNYKEILNQKEVLLHNRTILEAMQNIEFRQIIFLLIWNQRERTWLALWLEYVICAQQVRGLNLRKVTGGGKKGIRP